VLHLDKKSGYRPPTPLHKALSRPKPEVIVPVVEAPKPAPMKMEIAPQKVEAPAPIVPEVKAEMPKVEPSKIEEPKIEEPNIEPPVVVPERLPTPVIEIDPNAPKDLLLPFSDPNMELNKDNEPKSQILHFDRKKFTEPPKIEEIPEAKEDYVPILPELEQSKFDTSFIEPPSVEMLVYNPLAPKDIRLPYSDPNQNMNKEAMPKS
jgi:hypothetical protein